MAKKTDIFSQILALVREVEPYYSPDQAEDIANFAMENKQFRKLLQEQAKIERRTRAEASVAREQGETFIEAARRTGGARASGGVGVEQRVLDSVTTRKVGERLRELDAQARERAAVERLISEGVIDPEARRFESAMIQGPEATQEFLERQSEAKAGQLGRIRQRMAPGARSPVLSQQTFVDPFGPEDRKIMIENRVTNRPTDRVETLVLAEDDAGKIRPTQAKEVVNEPGTRRSLGKGFKKSPIYQHAIQFARGQGRRLSQEDIDALPRRWRRALEKFKSEDIQVFENELPNGKKSYGIIRRGFRPQAGGGEQIVKTFRIEGGTVKQIEEFTGSKVNPESARDHINKMFGYETVEPGSYDYKRAVAKAKLQGARNVVVKRNLTGDLVVTGVASPGRFGPRAFLKSEAYDVGEGAPRTTVKDPNVKTRTVTVADTAKTEGIIPSPPGEKFKSYAKKPVVVGGRTYPGGVSSVEQVRRDLRAEGFEEARPARNLVPRGETEVPPPSGRPRKPSKTRRLVRPGRPDQQIGPITEELAIRSEIKQGIVRRLRNNEKYKNNPVLLRKVAEEQAKKLIEEKGLAGAVASEIEASRKDIRMMVESGADVPSRAADRINLLEATQEELNRLTVDAEGRPTKTSRQAGSEERVRRRQEEYRLQEGTPETRPTAAGKKPTKPARRKGLQTVRVPVVGPREVPLGLRAQGLRDLLGDRVYKRLIEMSGGDDMSRVMDLVEKIVKRGRRSHPLLRALGVVIPR